VLERDIVDELHDDHGLANAGATEETRFPALGIGLEEIDDLDAGLEHLGFGGLLGQRRRFAMDRQAFFRFHRSSSVHGIPEDAEDPAKGLSPYRNRDRLSEIDGLHPPNHAVGGLHGDAPRPVFTQVEGDLGGDIDGHLPHVTVIDDLDRIENRRQVLVGKLHIHHRADDLDDTAVDLLTHKSSTPYPSSACAPETISISSLVIAA